MAGVKRGWMKPLAVAVLLFGAGMPMHAQSARSGSLTGKLTDLHSAPLAGATVVLRNQATGAEMRTTTTRNGDYRFTALDAGTYTIEADSGRVGHGRRSGILVSAGHDARVQTAMQFDLAPSMPVRAIFLKNPELNATGATALAAALPIETPRQLPLTGPLVAGEVHELPTEAPAAQRHARAGTIAASPLQYVTHNRATAGSRSRNPCYWRLSKNRVVRCGGGQPKSDYKRISSVRPASRHAAEPTESKRYSGPESEPHSGGIATVRPGGRGGNYDTHRHGTASAAFERTALGRVYP